MTDDAATEQICPRCEGTGTINPETHFWIVVSHGDTLDYWGPYVSAEVARQSRMYRPGFGYAVVEVPFFVPAECLTGLRLTHGADHADAHAAAPEVPSTDLSA